MDAAATVKERPILFSGAMVRALLAGTKTQTRRLVKPQPTPATWAQAGANLGGDVRAARPVVHPLFGIGLRRDGTEFAGIGFPEPNIRCPYGEAGERLWVRETHAVVPYSAYHHASSEIPHRVSPDGVWWAVYREGWTRCAPDPWKPSIHMPRWAARIVLELTDVRVQRLHDISEDDAKAEGVAPNWMSDDLSGGIGRGWNEAADGWHNYAYPPHYAGEDYEPLFTARESYGSLWDAINGAGAWSANPWVWALTFRRVTP
jgi:hypothetical protein